MDLIFLLLVSQLLLVIAIILTSTHVKEAKASDLGLSKLFSAIITIIGFNKEDDYFVDKPAAAVAENSPIDCSKNSSVSEEAVSDSFDNDNMTLSDKYRNKGNKQARERNSETFESLNTDYSPNDDNYLLKDSTKSFSLAKIFKWLNPVKFTKSAVKTNTKKTVKSPNLNHFCINSNITVTASSISQQSKPIQSAYLSKIIALRKTENAIRLKVSKLNLAIFKDRKVRPLPPIAELTETTG